MFRAQHDPRNDGLWRPFPRPHCLESKIIIAIKPFPEKPSLHFEARNQRGDEGYIHSADMKELGGDGEGPLLFGLAEVYVVPPRPCSKAM